MKKKKRILYQALLAVTLLFLTPESVYAAGGWLKSSVPSQEPGLSSGWWYSLNQDNTMWYAALKAHDSAPAWYWIDGNQDGMAECYAFNQAGWMYSEITTPDGYTVNSEGMWTVNGSVQINAVKTNLDKPSSIGGKSSSSGGGGGHSWPPEKPEILPEEEKVTYSYFIRLVDIEDGSLIKEIAGNGMKGEDIAFGSYMMDGYFIVEDQALSAPLLEDKCIFTVAFKRDEDMPAASGSDADKLYRYTIRYMDINTKAILMTDIGRSRENSIIEIAQPDIPDYKICPDQPEALRLSSDNMIQKIYYEAVEEENLPEASPSEANKVNWTVHFMDDYDTKIWPSQTGNILEGGVLTINFPGIIYGKDGEIWESVELPPIERTIYGPGVCIEYVEFTNIGRLPDEPNPDQEGKKLLEDYLITAKDYEMEITGENTNKIPNSRFIVTNQSSNDYRVRSIATQTNDTDEHVFYVIGKNFVPNGKTITEWFGETAVYSNLLEQVIRISNDTYYVARMCIQRSFASSNCSHNWQIKKQTAATCLGKGKITTICRKCGDEREEVTAPLGHIDTDNSSICDRCYKRAIPQELGSQINTSLAGMELTFTCIDTDYNRGMLYLADQNIPLNLFKGYGAAEYSQSNIYKYFRDGFQNGFSLKNGMLGIESGSGIAYAMSLTKEDYERYRDKIIEGRFMLQDNENESVWGIDENGNYVLLAPADISYGIRPAIVLEKSDTGIPDRIHWNIGDIQAREIDEKTYIFRCIDQNYSDDGANHKQTALFLSETVIPANYGSDYKVEQLPNGSRKYVFKPGPIVNFGESNDYKYSNLTKWLEQSKDNFYNMESVNIGINYAFMGSTADQEFSSFDANSLQPYYIGNQQLKEQAFILSIDEAIKYKKFLWKFEGSDEENPDTQYSAFSKGYWLRNPMGTTEDYDTGYAYVVDLVNGSIHPASVKPLIMAGNDELDVTTPYGIRVAFTMPQD